MSAAEMFVVPAMMLMGLYFLFCGRGQDDRIFAGAPHSTAIPVSRPAVVSIIFFLVLAGNRPMRFDRRTKFDLLPGEVHEQSFLISVPMAESVRRKQDVPLVQPGPRIYDQVANGPRLVIEVEILHVANLAIRCGELVAIKFFDIL
jgi:hypothetical protein